MLQRLFPSRASRAGYTLVELAIVLAVAGLLFTGLWRLLAGGNLQLKDAATATQQQQLISAVKGYLLSSEGVSIITTKGAGTAWQLLMPSSAATAAGTAGCATDGNMTNTPGFCNYLPSGFWSGTTNPYGQTYNVYVLNSTPATSYSFMIVTSGGETISDSSGGRISSQIGADGGFIYNNNVCGAPAASNACGAYGAWSQTLAANQNYKITPPGTGGYVASRTYYTPDQDANQPWLARTLLNNNIGYNTMSTNLFLGGQNAYMGISTTATTGGGSVNLQDGTINLQGGILEDYASNAPNNSSPQISLVRNQVSSGNSTNPRPELVTDGGCLQTIPPTDDTSTSPPTIKSTDPCKFSIQTTDEVVSNFLATNYLWAFTFLYNGSDRRMKEDIHPLDHVMEQVMRLKPVSFKMKADGKKSMGVIAQDLEQVYPQLVVGAKDGMKSVNYQGLIGPLIAAVQELKRQNDELRMEIDQLKATGKQ